MKYFDPPFCHQIIKPLKLIATCLEFSFALQLFVPSRAVSSTLQLVAFSLLLSKVGLFRRAKVFCLPQQPFLSAVALSDVEWHGHCYNEA